MSGISTKTGARMAPQLISAVVEAMEAVALVAPGDVLDLVQSVKLVF